MIVKLTNFVAGPSDRPPARPIELPKFEIQLLMQSLFKKYVYRQIKEPT